MVRPADVPFLLRRIAAEPPAGAPGFRGTAGTTSVYLPLRLAPPSHLAPQLGIRHVDHAEGHQAPAGEFGEETRCWETFVRSAVVSVDPLFSGGSMPVRISHVTVPLISVPRSRN